MSHSTIFKITDGKEEFELLKEYEFEDIGFLDGYHDSIGSFTKKEIEREYNNLNGNMGFFIVKKKGEYYYLTLKLEDLKHAYLTNLRYARDLLDAHIKEIEENVPTNSGLYKIDQLINGAKDGYYFYYSGSYYTKFELIEMLVNSREYIFKDTDSITFRLEGALDYHY